MNSSLNRRDSIRYPAVENRALMTWKLNDSFEQIEIRVVNLSQSGALCLAEQPLPAEQVVWVRLIEPESLDWVEAAVVVSAALGSPSTAYHVRLRFLSTPLPYTFYKTAIHGNVRDDSATVAI